MKYEKTATSESGLGISIVPEDAQVRLTASPRTTPPRGSFRNLGQHAPVVFRYVRNALYKLQVCRRVPVHVQQSLVAVAMAITSDGLRYAMTQFENT